MSDGESWQNQNQNMCQVLLWIRSQPASEPSEVAPHLCAGHHAHQLQLIFIFIWSDTHHITRLSSVRATGVTGHTNTLSTVVQTRFILLFKFYHAAPDKLENTTQALTTDRRTVCLEAEQNEM